MTERLNLQVLFRFMLSLRHVDFDKHEGDVLLVKNSGHAFSAGGGGGTIEF